MFRALVSVVTLFILIGFSPSHAENLCENTEIGTQLNLEIAQTNGLKVPKIFVVQKCENNVYFAKGSSRVETVLTYKAGQGEVRQVEFVSSEKNDEFISASFANWNVSTGEILFDQKPPLAQAKPVCSPACAPGEHCNAQNMCVEDDPIPSCSPACKPGTHCDSQNMCVLDPPHTCPPGQHWDTSMGMGMCMPDAKVGENLVSFHYNQFLVRTDSTGLRGRGAWTGPNMWMLNVNRKITEKNEVGLSWMGTTDLWSIPKTGTPEIFQAGESNKQGVPFIDAQHPHSSPIMGLTLSDILTLGNKGQHKLTFFFAPRGEATAGPESFMHRASSEGNVDAPLGHHLQDVFHISSTVVGAKLLLNGKTSIDASVFSGKEPSPSEVNLDMHRPDSYAFKVTHQITDKISVGGTYAKMIAQDREGGIITKEHEQAYAGWVSTNNMIKGGTLNTSSIWGAVSNREQNRTLNSFLEEYLYELGKNGFFGRFEVVQRTPEQLDIVLTDGKSGAQWVKAITIGYERNFYTRGNMKLYAGGAETKGYATEAIAPAYGGNPWTSKGFLRITWGGNKILNPKPVDRFAPKPP